MSSVDRRSVKMEFDNAQFERGISSSTKSLDTFKKSLNLDSAVKGLSSLSTISSNVETIASKFNVLGLVGVTALMNIANQAINTGKQLITSLTIAPITTGFNEYELKMAAVQTIMAGTGESVGTVMKYLEELNEYSDKTIYSFSDMTTNIAKFTNAGVSLKDSVAAIQGIANVAALSGANANEAARSMYNFSQAISSGYVKLIDWKSIELANMATVSFKEQLIASAVAAGTLTKAANGMYMTVGGTLISATKNFNDSLQDQWLTTKVLTTTLGKYADGTTDIGKKAFAAAQDVKTMSMMLSTLKEAAQSGWAQTWELLFGNFEEAKIFFTGLTNSISELLNASARARNGLLKDWKDLGGRTMLIEGLKNIFQSLVSVLTTVQKAFQEVFPPMTGKNLFDLTKGFRDLTNIFKVNSGSLEAIRKIFVGLFSVLDIVRLAIVAVVGSFGGLFGSVGPASGGILELGTRFGDFLINLRKTVIANNTFVKAIDNLKASLSNLVPKIQEYAASLQPFFTKIGEFFYGIFDAIKKQVSNMPQIFSSIQGFFGSIDLSGLSTFVEKVKEKFGELAKFGEPIKEAFAKIADSMRVTFSNLAAIGDAIWKALGSLGKTISDALKGISFNDALNAFNVGLLAGIFASLRKISQKNNAPMGELKDLLLNIKGILDSVRGSIEAWQKNIQAKTMLTIASAIALLAASLIALSLIDEKKLSDSLSVITMLFMNLIGAMALFNKLPGGSGGIGASVQLMGIAASVMVLSVALAALSALDKNKLSQGLNALLAMLVGLLVFAKGLSLVQGQMVKAAGLFIAVAVSINLLTIAVKTLGSLDLETLKKGLIGVGVLLAEVTVALRVINSTASKPASISGLISMSIAILLLSKTVEAFGKLDPTVLLQGMVGVASLLTALAAFVKVTNNSKGVISTGIGLTILAAGLVVLTTVIREMGSMSWETLGKGMLAMAASLGVVAIAMKAMTKAIPGAIALTIVAGALALFVPVLKLLGNLSLTEIGIGLLAMAGIFAVVGLAGLLLKPLVPVFIALAGAIALFGLGITAIGLGMLAFSAGLAALAASGAGAAVAFGLLIDTLITRIPAIVVALVNGIVSFATQIAAASPQLVAATVTTVMALVNGVVSTAPKLIDAAMTLILALLQGINSKLPEVLQAGFDILLTLLKGLADNIEEVTEAAIDVILKFLEGVEDKIPDIVQGGFDLVVALVDGIGKGFKDNMPRLLDSLARFAGDILTGLIDGLKAGLSRVGDVIKDVGRSIEDAWKKFWGINSPAKRMLPIGSSITEGMLLGMTNASKMIDGRVEDVGKKVTAGLSGVRDTIDNLLAADINSAPVITPVVDLTEVEASGKEIGKLLPNKISIPTTSKLTAAVVATGNASSIQNTQPVNTTGNVQFVQNNYSPKALSRIDIYRQTRNQLLAMKGLAVNS